MTDAVKAREGTVLSELQEALLRSGEFNAQDQVAPVAVLWTDLDRQWEPLAPRLRETLPQFLILGSYAPGERKGPAIWIRCMIDRALPEADWPERVVPILYLPGMSRHELRVLQDCPRELQPLAELQYRGVWFTQDSTRDWTVFAFLTSNRGGLGLDVAGNGATREAILLALGKLADTPVAELRGRRLHAADFQALLQPDLVKQLLRWLDAPETARQASTVEEWQAFRGACAERYGFDPERDGELAGAEKLGARDGNWDTVWSRFAEAPGTYPNLPELLRRAKPKDDKLPLFFHRECWPQYNEQDEDDLRERLGRLASFTPDSAGAEIEKLESSHGVRRASVWARLGHAPLAIAIEHLALLSRTTRTNFGGENIRAMAIFYASEGWRADAAMLDALAAVSKPADMGAVRVAVRALYKPWLEAGAEYFQNLVHENPGEVHGTSPKGLAEVVPGTCLIFADGLRLDLGKRLRTALETAGFHVEEAWRFAPVPPVTPTAKPVASPVADLVTGEGSDGVEFQPVVRETGQPLISERFRKLLTERGFQALQGDDTGDPAGRGWTERGDIDQLGHEEGWKLARRLVEEIIGLLDRIRDLFDAGWREIRVLTDHGWLLLPGGLPKVEMPQYLVESRWTRCGTLKPGAKVELLTAPWHWNPEVQVALAPGIGSFRANTEYSHGSLSLQECVVLDLVVRPAQPSGPSGTIQTVRWTGLRCRIQVVGAGAGWQVDLRTRVGDPASSLAKHKEPRPIDPDGDSSLVVDDPEHDGTAAMVVLLDPEGHVAAKHSTTVGGEE